jgi:tetratricopeptide (TPR) repeat protein
VRIVPLCSALGAAILFQSTAPYLSYAADPPAAAAAAPAPSEEELDAAKEHFGKGKELYDKGDKKAAVEEFKLAYKLSRNAILLYNVALVFDELADKALALHYYQKFLKDAPDNDRTKENKKIATGRVAVLTKELSADDDLDGKPAEAPKPVTPPPPAEPAKKAAVTAFTHVTLDEAPPEKPIDIAAQIPEGSNWKLSLYYRIQGKDEFTPVPMKVRFDELVGRIPANVVRGQSVQYYIEVKDAQGRLVAQSGSPASPNIVYLDAKAKSHYYFQEGDPVIEEVKPEAAKPEAKPDAASEGLDDEDPLGEGKGVRGQLDSDIDLGGSSHPSQSGEGPSDQGKLDWAKWGTTGGAAVLLGTSVFFYVAAKNYSTQIEDDVKNRTCNPSPCQFDSTAQDWQSTGKTYSAIYYGTLVAGAITAGVAGYFWYKDLKRPHRGAYPTKPASDTARGESSTHFVAAPMIGEGIVGGAAVFSW